LVGRIRYTYDGFGNLTDQTVIKGSAPSMHVVYNAATNQQTGDFADANGNIGGGTYGGPTYDVENRLQGVVNQYQYSYAPGNKRVWRAVFTPDGNGNFPQTTDEVAFWSVNGQKLGKRLSNPS